MDNHNSFNQAEGVDKALSLLEQSIKDKIESSQREARLSDRLIAELEARVASLEAQLAIKKWGQKHGENSDGNTSKMRVKIEEKSAAKIALILLRICL